MNFTRFPANTTNVFPIANAVTGGQLLTEFNLRSRESVLSSDEIKYFVCPSYVHGLEDFAIRKQQDELGNSISSTILEITSGRAVVNGHYIESISNIEIDIAEANVELQSLGKDPLKGQLAVGLRAMYSTEQTLAASMRTVDGKNMLEGIQVVILPIGKIADGYFVLPEDSPDNEEYVTAHIKLGEFYFVNGTIRSITQNDEKIQYIPASRIGDFGNLLSSTYITRKGLNPKKLYTFAGKSNDPKSTKDTWCDSTDSLFIWQRASDLKTTTDKQLKQAEFGVDEHEYTTLTLPHKQVDGGMYNTDGKEVFYTPRVMKLPQANFASNSPGTVTASYTRSIKSIKEAIANFYHLPAGKQRSYVEILEDDERTALPTINQKNWNVGDYVLVEKDQSVVTSYSDLIQAPSSFYVVLPPVVTDVQFIKVNAKGEGDKSGIVIGNSAIPSGLTGVEIARMDYEYGQGSVGDYFKYDSSLTEEENKADYDSIIEDFIKAYLPFMEEDEDGNKVLNEDYKETFNLESNAYRGDLNVDYICIKVANVPLYKTGTTTYYFYYKVTKNEGAKEYSNPVLLTGSIPLATEDTIGGFLNVPDTAYDNGYIYRDTDGHLKLLDYSLLRSGVLAYQLGQDYDIGAGESNETIQEYLDEYINNRVAFPTDEQIANASYPNMLEITLTLGEQETYSTITLENIDSRYGTGIILHILGTATSYTTINIINCEKIKIGSLEGEPVINVYNSGLFYDADIIEYINTCQRVHEYDSYDKASGVPVYRSNFTGIENLSLWYQKFDDSDANLIVDGMTIMETDTPVIPDDYDFWSESVVNDNHYYYGLQSLTFRPNGRLAGCGLYMRNDTTFNEDFGTTVAVAQFVLPQGTNFTYPKSSLQVPIKITGTFVTAYPYQDPDSYATMTTTFTALTQTYGEYSEATGYSDIGTISFLSKSELVTNYLGVEAGTAIDGWEANSYHVFKGWSIG